MSRVLVIGLLRSMTQRFNIECARKGIDSNLVQADFGNKGNTYKLIPYPGEAINAVRAYAEKLENWGDALIIVMPYTEIPAELDGELDVLSGEGAKVVRAESAVNGWPAIPKKSKADAALIEQIWQRLWSEIPTPSTVAEEEDVLPSEYFRQVCDANPRVIVADQVYVTCNQVEPIRRDFLKRAINALAEFVRDGSNGPIETFFRTRQLNHAKTGPNRSTLNLTFRGRVVVSETVETHLKQGDATTPQGAARLYYHHTMVDGDRCVVVTYAGPHPVGHFTRDCVCPDTEL